MNFMHILCIVDS